MPRKPSYRTACRLLRKRGVSPAEAKSRAQTLSTKLEKIKRKKEFGLTSQEAFDELYRIEKLDRTIEKLKKINSAYKISRSEADVVLKNAISIQHLIIMDSNASYLFETYLRDYASLRFASGSKDMGNSERILNRFTQIVEKRTHRSNMRSAVLKILHFPGPIPERESSTTRNFFKRVLLEKGENNPQYQQRGLAMAMSDDMRSRTNVLSIQPLVDLLKKGVEDLKKPTTQEFMRKIKSSVADFDAKPENIRVRIVQEWRATEFGKEIASNMRKFHEKSIEMMEFYLDEFGTEAKLSHDVQNSIRYHEWVLKCLSLPHNHEFLAQKAIDWYRRFR